jgi:hypothetical protein
MIPKYMNVRPARMRDIPWPWKSDKSPADLSIPPLATYYDFHTFLLEDCDGKVTSYGTRDHKSIFSTAVRLFGLERLLKELPSLSPITEEYISWNALLYKMSPFDIDRFVIGDSFADKNGLLIPRALFKTWVLPQYERLLHQSGAREHSAVFMVTEGDVYEILEDLAALGLTGLFYQPIGEMEKCLCTDCLDNMMLFPVKGEI